MINEIKKILSSREPEICHNETSGFSHASVLIPLFQENGSIKVLFTKRTDLVEHHKRQICFPGGSVDDRDVSYEETALREACEEIGLKAEHVNILGQIDDSVTTISRFIIHSFVGLIPFPYAFRINRFEVEKFIFVPLDFFKPENITEDCLVKSDGKNVLTWGYKYQYEIIWGATARMMRNFIKIINPEK